MAVIDPNLQWQYIQETGDLVDVTEYTSISEYLQSKINYDNYIQRNFGTEAEFEAYMRAKYGTEYKPIQSTELTETSITSKVVEVGETTGGSSVLDMIETADYTSTAEAGAVTAVGGGTVVAISADVAVPTILAGIGLGWASYEVGTPLWLAISNKLFGTDIPLEQATEYNILGIYKNDTLYIPEEVIQAVSDALYEADAYSGYTYSINSTITHTGMQNVTYTELSNADIQAVGRNVGIGVPSVLINYLRFELHRTHPLMRIVQCEVSSYEDRIRIAFDCVTDESEYIDVKQTSAGLYYVNRNTLRISAWYLFSDGSVEVDTQPYTHEYTIESGYGGGYTVGGMDVEIENSLDTEGLYLLPDSNLNIDGSSIGAYYKDWNNKAIDLTTYNPKSSTDPSENTFNKHKFFPISLPSIYPFNPTVPFMPPSQDFSQQGKTPSKDYVIQGSGINTPTPPKQDEGNTPSIPPVPSIGGSSNALFTVYNPAMAQLNGLGNVLWSQSILEQIVRMFTNNPMDAIISLHVIYATPSIGGTKNIKLGYIDTGVASPWVDSQYVKVPCGTVTVPEYYGDARDYIGSTDVSIYLPFVGIRALKTADIIGSTVTVDYTVDVYTGTVLCNITVNKRGTTKVMYTFEGNCAVSIPLTGSDRSRQISSIGTMIAGGAVGGVGGLLLTGAGAVASGGMQASVQRTSNFSGNAGAMGIKTPYIIVNRNIPYDADNYNELYGYTSNKTVVLGTLTGYTRVKSVHVDNCDYATVEERNEIERLLKTGVIF